MCSILKAIRFLAIIMVIDEFLLLVMLVMFFQGLLEVLLSSLLCNALCLLLGLHARDLEQLLETSGGGSKVRLDHGLDHRGVEISKFDPRVFVYNGFAFVQSGRVRLHLLAFVDSGRAWRRPRRGLAGCRLLELVRRGA